MDLYAALRPNGVLFSSNPRGDGQEGWNGDRYGAFYNWETWRDYMTAAGFVEITHFYRPAGLPREQQPWLACGANQRRDGGSVRPSSAEVHSVRYRECLINVAEDW